MKIQKLIERMSESQEEFKEYLIDIVRQSNGLFSSRKQQTYVLSTTKNQNPYIILDKMLDNQIEWIFYFDYDGITKIVKRANNKDTLMFQRT